MQGLVMFLGSVFDKLVRDLFSEVILREPKVREDQVKLWKTRTTTTINQSINQSLLAPLEKGIPKELYSYSKIESTATWLEIIANACRAKWVRFEIPWNVLTVNIPLHLWRLTVKNNLFWLLKVKFWSVWHLTVNPIETLPLYNTFLTL